MAYGFLLIYWRDFAPGKEAWVANYAVGTHFEARLAHVHGNLFAFLNIVIGYLLWQLPVQAISTNSESSFSDLGGAFDVDGDALAPVLIVVAVGAIVLVILGGGMFIIYQAPSILSDAAFEALLASGFLRSTRDISSGNWIGSIIKRTWIPFRIITLVATMSGWTIGYFCPVALQLLEIQYCL